MLDRPEMPLLFPPLKSAMVSCTGGMPVTELYFALCRTPVPGTTGRWRSEARSHYIRSSRHDKVGSRVRDHNTQGWL